MLRLILALFLPLSLWASELTSIQMMVDGFGGKCTINGEWTQLATQNISTLVAVLESVKDDAACQSASSAIANLRAANQHLNEYNQPHSDLEIEIRDLQGQQSELLTLIAGTADPTELSTLNSLLFSTQRQLAGARRKRRFDNNNREARRIQHASSMLANTMQDVLSQLADNERCWDQRPALLATLAGLGAAVSQSTALAVGTGGMSTVIGAGVQLGAELINYIKQRRWQKRISKIARPAQITALSCAMETMIANWCDARDVIQAVDIVVKSQFDDEDSLSDGRLALRLLDRNLPKLNEWLGLVRVGSTPSNSPVAQRLSSIFDEEAELKKVRPIVSGIINEEESSFVGSERDLWSLEQRIVNRIVSAIFNRDQFGRTDLTNPMTDIYSVSVAPYILIGLEENEVPRNVNGILDFSTFLPGQFGGTNGGEPAPTIEINSDSLRNVVEKRFFDWYETAIQRFEIRKRQLLFDDPERIFSNAEKESLIGENKRLSSKGSLKKLIQFLENHRPDGNGHYAWMYNIHRDTLERLQNIYAVIDSINQPRTPEDVLLCGKSNADLTDEERQRKERVCPLEGLRKVEKDANLENGITFLSDRIEDLLRIVIEDELVNSATARRNESLQYMAADDLVRRLLQFSSRDSWRALVADAKNSQRLAQSSILAFGPAFQNQIKESFEMLEDHIEEFDEDENGANRHIKTEFCLNMMALPNWNRRLGLDACLQESHTSIFPNAPRSPVFTKAQFSKKFGDRICEFHDYKKRIDILQKFGSDGF